MTNQYACMQDDAFLSIEKASTSCQLSRVKIEIDPLVPATEYKQQQRTLEDTHEDKQCEDLSQVSNDSVSPSTGEPSSVRVDGNYCSRTSLNCAVSPSTKGTKDSGVKDDDKNHSFIPQKLSKNNKGSFGFELNSPRLPAGSKPKDRLVEYFDKIQAFNGDRVFPYYEIFAMDMYRKGLVNDKDVVHSDFFLKHFKKWSYCIEVLWSHFRRLDDTCKQLKPHLFHQSLYQIVQQKSCKFQDIDNVTAEKIVNLFYRCFAVDDQSGFCIKWFQSIPPILQYDMDNRLMDFPRIEEYPHGFSWPTLDDDVLTDHFDSERSRVLSILSTYGQSRVDVSDYVLHVAAEVFTQRTGLPSTHHNIEVRWSPIAVLQLDALTRLSLMKTFADCERTFKISLFLNLFQSYFTIYSHDHRCSDRDVKEELRNILDADSVQRSLHMGAMESALDCGWRKSLRTSIVPDTVPDTFKDHIAELMDKYSGMLDQAQGLFDFGFKTNLDRVSDSAVDVLSTIKETIGKASDHIDNFAQRAKDSMSEAASGFAKFIKYIFIAFSTFSLLLFGGGSKIISMVSKIAGMICTAVGFIGDKASACLTYLSDFLTSALGSGTLDRSEMETIVLEESLVSKIKQFVVGFVFVYLFNKAPDHRKIQTIMKTVSDYDRSKAGLEGVFSWLLDLVTSSLNTVCKFLNVDTLFMLSTGRSEVDNWADEALKLKSGFDANTLDNAYSTYSAISDVVMRGNRLLSKFRDLKEHSICNKIVDIIKALEPMVQAYDHFRCTGDYSRPCPYALNLVGSSGVGKSASCLHFVSDLSRATQSSTLNFSSYKDVSSSIFNVSPGMEHFDGVTQQPVWLSDDAFQCTDVAGNPKNEYLTFIKTVSNTPFHLPAAALPLKAGLFCNAKLFISTSNRLCFKDINSVISPEAVERRFNQQLLVFPRQDFCKPGTYSANDDSFQSYLDRRLDQDKIFAWRKEHSVTLPSGKDFSEFFVKEAIMFRAYKRKTAGSSEMPHFTTKAMTYDEVIKFVAADYDKHTDAQNQMIGQLLDEVYKDCEDHNPKTDWKEYKEYLEAQKLDHAQCEQPKSGLLSQQSHLKAIPSLESYIMAPFRALWDGFYDEHIGRLSARAGGDVRPVLATDPTVRSYYIRLGCYHGKPGFREHNGNYYFQEEQAVPLPDLEDLSFENLYDEPSWLVVHQSSESYEEAVDRFMEMSREASAAVNTSTTVASLKDRVGKWLVRAKDIAFRGIKSILSTIGIEIDYLAHKSLIGINSLETIFSYYLEKWLEISGFTRFIILFSIGFIGGTLYDIFTGKYSDKKTRDQDTVIEILSEEQLDESVLDEPQGGKKGNKGKSKKAKSAQTEYYDSQVEDKITDIWNRKGGKRKDIANDIYNEFEHMSKGEILSKYSVYHLDQAQAVRDSPCKNIITSVVNNNQYFVTCCASRLRVTIVENNYMISPSHYWKAIEKVVCDDTVVTFERISNGKEYRITWKELKTLIYTPTWIDDISICHCPFIKERHKSIVDKFLTEHDIEGMRNNPVLMIAPEKTDKGINFNVFSAGRSNLTRATLNKDGEVPVRRSIVYEFWTEAGHCGSIVAVMHLHQQRKIIGFHAVGSSTQIFGGATIFSQDNYNKLKTEYDALNSMTAQAYSGNVVYSGTFRRGYLYPDKCKYTKSILHDYLEEYTGQFKPAVLYERSAGEMERDFGDTGGSCCPIDEYLKRIDAPGRWEPDEEVMEQAVYKVKAEIRSKLRDFNRTIPTSYPECVTGFDGLDSMPRNTSPGLPWCKDPNIKGGREHFVGKEMDYNFDNDNWKSFEKHLATIDYKLKSGRAEFLYTLFPKDEILPIKKQARGGTRCISGCDFSLGILARKYFGSFMAACYESGTKVGFAITENPYGEEIDLFVRLIQTYMTESSRCEDGDYSKFDTSHMPQMMEYVLDIAQEFYGDDGYDQVRYNIFRDIVNPRTVKGKDILEWTKGMPSGNPMTTIINCICNKIATTYAVLRYNKEELGYPDWDPDRMFKGWYCGDDMIYVYDTRVVGNMSAAHLTRYYAEINYKFTSALKEEQDDLTIVNNKGICDIQFLKRRWRFEEIVGRYVYALDVNSIIRMVSFVSDERRHDELLGTTLNWAQLELSQHSPEVYEQKIQLLQRAVKRSNFDYSFPYSTRKLALTALNDTSRFGRKDVLHRMLMENWNFGASVIDADEGEDVQDWSSILDQPQMDVGDQRTETGDQPQDGVDGGDPYRTTFAEPSDDVTYAPPEPDAELRDSAAETEAIKMPTEYEKMLQTAHLYDQGIWTNQNGEGVLSSYFINLDDLIAVVPQYFDVFKYYQGVNGSLFFRLKVISSPLVSGNVCMSYTPDRAFNQLNYINRQLNTSTLSQLPGSSIDCKQGELVLEFPYLQPYNAAYVNFPESGWGQLTIWTPTGFRALTDTVKWHLYVYFSPDVTLSRPVNADRMSALMSQETMDKAYNPGTRAKLSARLLKAREDIEKLFEIEFTDKMGNYLDRPQGIFEFFKKTKPSKVAGVVQDVATVAEGVPIIGSAAKAVSKVASVAKDVFSFFGFSKENPTDIPSRVVTYLIGSGIHINGTEDVVTFGHNFGTSLGYFPGPDHMSIPYIIQVEGLKENVPLNLGILTAGSLLFEFDCAPFLPSQVQKVNFTHNAVTGVAANSEIWAPLPYEGVGSLFHYYRGQFQFRLRIHKTAYHKLSVAAVVSYDLTGMKAEDQVFYKDTLSVLPVNYEDSAVVPRVIMNFNDIDEYTFTVPWMSKENFLKVNQPYAKLQLYLVEAQYNVTTTAPTVDMCVWISMDKDSQFVLPSKYTPVPFVSGGPTPSLGDFIDPWPADDSTDPNITWPYPPNQTPPLSTIEIPSDTVAQSASMAGNKDTVSADLTQVIKSQVIEFAGVGNGLGDTCDLAQQLYGEQIHSLKQLCMMEGSMTKVKYPYFFPHQLCGYKPNQVGRLVLPHDAIIDLSNWVCQAYGFWKGGVNFLFVPYPVRGDQSTGLFGEVEIAYAPSRTVYTEIEDIETTFGMKMPEVHAGARSQLIAYNGGIESLTKVKVPMAIEYPYSNVSLTSTNYLGAMFTPGAHLLTNHPTTPITRLKVIDYNKCRYKVRKSTADDLHCNVFLGFPPYAHSNIIQPENGFDYPTEIQRLYPFRRDQADLHWPNDLSYTGAGLPTPV